MPLYERHWYRISSCTLLMLAGIGLVRYAYSPLTASMLHDHWLTAAEIGYVSTFNFIGNLIGALLCAGLAKRFTPGWVSRFALLIGLVSVTASAVDLGFVWLATWRFFAGLTAAAAMVLAPLMAIAGIKALARSAVIGTVFVGAGIGIIGLSLLLPEFLDHGPSGGWLFTGGLVAGCLLLSWAGLSPRIEIGQNSPHESTISRRPRGIVMLWLAYLLMAAGVVPHSIYLSAYLHDAMHQPIGFSTMVYAVYGLGVLLGGPIYGGLVHRFLGTHLALIATVFSAMAAVMIVIVSGPLWLIVASAALLGAAQMGNSSCTTHRLLEMVGTSAHAKWWGRFGISYNIGLAGGAFLMGAMVHLGWGYLAGFWMAAIALSLAVLLLIAFRGAPPDIVEASHDE
ncbi:MAG: MFS transporter [Phycisphaerales bacterium]|nr:MFS transporter [Phycisphaerales bacterium]